MLQHIYYLEGAKRRRTLLVKKEEGVLVSARREGNVSQEELLSEPGATGQPNFKPTPNTHQSLVRVLVGRVCIVGGCCRLDKILSLQPMSVACCSSGGQPLGNGAWFVVPCNMNRSVAPLDSCVLCLLQKYI